MTTNGCRAAKSTPPKTVGDTHLAVTFDLGDHSVEAATTLVARWLEGELEAPVRLISVTSVRVGGDQAIPDPAKLITARRRQLSLSQRALAALADVSQNTVCLIERGRIGADSPSAVAVRQALAAVEAAR